MTASYLIGTAEDCHIRIVDQYASARHARVWQDDSGRVWAVDLGSANGTRIRRAGQDLRVTAPRELQPGDVLVVGRTTFPWTPREATHDPDRSH